MSSIPVSKIIDVILNKEVQSRILNKEYDSYKDMLYALQSDIDVRTLCTGKIGKQTEFMLQLTKAELITLINNRRVKLHEQLNSI